MQEFHPFQINKGVQNSERLPTMSILASFKSLHLVCALKGAWGSVVVKALRYKSEGPGIDPRSCHWGFFPTSPCAQPLNTKSRSIIYTQTPLEVPCL